MAKKKRKNKGGQRSKSRQKQHQHDRLSADVIASLNQEIAEYERKRNLNR